MFLCFCVFCFFGFSHNIQCSRELHFILLCFLYLLHRGAIWVVIPPVFSIDLFALRPSPGGGYFQFSHNSTIKTPFLFKFNTLIFQVEESFILVVSHLAVVMESYRNDAIIASQSSHVCNDTAIYSLF